MEFDPDEPSEHTACAYLQEQGYVESTNGFWTKPHPDHRVTSLELSAIWYLIEEWDFGGVMDG